jgi:hypothetical protein
VIVYRRAFASLADMTDSALEGANLSSSTGDVGGVVVLSESLALLCYSRELVGFGGRYDADYATRRRSLPMLETCNCELDEEFDRWRGGTTIFISSKQSITGTLCYD